MLDSACAVDTSLPCDTNGGGGTASRIYSYLAAGKVGANTWSKP